MNYNPFFRKTYSTIIQQLQANGEIQPIRFAEGEDKENSTLLSDLLMENEKYKLHNWDKKNIFVKQPQDQVGQSVTQTILSLRRFLINEKIQRLNGQLEASSENDAHLLEEINMYNELRQLVSQNLVELFKLLAIAWDAGTNQTNCRHSILLKFGICRCLLSFD